MPTTKAKTAYGLLGDIAKIIRSEPLRYDQEIALEVGKALLDREEAPECGTVGCVAGWVVALTQAPRRQKHLSMCGGACAVAGGVLGLTSDQGQELFAATACMDTQPQTKAHALAGIAHIERFRKAHRAQLLKTPIQIGGRS